MISEEEKRKLGIESLSATDFVEASNWSNKPLHDGDQPSHKGHEVTKSGPTPTGTMGGQ